MSILTVVAQAVRAKFGRKGTAGPIPLSLAVRDSVKQISRWSLPYYLCVAALFLQATGLFRGVARVSDFAAITLPPIDSEPSRVCQQTAQQGWAELCHTRPDGPFPRHPTQSPPNCTLTHVVAASENIDRLLVWSDGFALSCSQKATDEFASKAQAELDRLRGQQRTDRVILVHSGVKRGAISHLQEMVKNEAEIDVAFEALGGGEALARRICNPNFQSYLQTNSLDVFDEATIALRLRQTLDTLVLGDNVLDNAKRYRERYLAAINVGDSVPCLPQETLKVDFADAGSVLLLNDDWEVEARLVATLRHLLGLNGETICSIIENAESRCQFNGRMIQDWELRERSATRKAHRTRENDEALRRIQTIGKMLSQHEATDAYLSLQKEAVELANRLMHTPLTTDEHERLSNTIHQLDTGDYLERRMYLSPSFVVALYGPVTVVFVLPLTTIVRKVLRKDTRAELTALWH